MRVFEFTFGLLTTVFVICSFSMFTNCTHNKDAPIKCIANYIEVKVEKEELNRFKKLEGVEVWRTWEDLTAHFAEDYSMIESCGVYEYMHNNQTPMNTFRGKVTFVFLIHSYLKNGYVDHDHVNSEVEKVILN